MFCWANACDTFGLIPRYVIHDVTSLTTTARFHIVRRHLHVHVQLYVPAAPLPSSTCTPCADVAWFRQHQTKYERRATSRTHLSHAPGPVIHTHLPDIALWRRLWASCRGTFARRSDCCLAWSYHPFRSAVVVSLFVKFTSSKWSQSTCIQGVECSPRKRVRKLIQRENKCLYPVRCRKYFDDVIHR